MSYIREQVMMDKVLLTGASGFVGQALLRAMLERQIPVVAAFRKRGAAFDDIDCVEVGELTAQQDWSLALKDVDRIVHTAARVHIMKEAESEPQQIFKRINTDATLNLALQAAQAGVKRFIFLSTVKVNGESTTGRMPFLEEDICQPSDPYAISKMEAEVGLMKIARETDMEVVIIRPPLIYGPGVKGNFVSLIKLMRKPLPLPFGEIHNQRSLLAVENLVSAILLVAQHPSAANQIFLVADNETISTTQLLENIAAAQGKKARLLPVPVNFMKVAAKLIGKQLVADRLFGSLVMDTHKIRQLLGWRPVVTMQQQLGEMFSESDGGFPPARE